MVPAQHDGDGSGPAALRLCVALVATFLPGPAPVRAAGEGACLDPAATDTVAAPGGEMRAASTLHTWPTGTVFVSEVFEERDGTTLFAGVFHAEARIRPSLSFGFPVTIEFDLSGMQGLAANGARSRLFLPIDLDLAGLPPGMTVRAEYSLVNDLLTTADEGVGRSSLSLERFSPGSQTVATGWLNAAGAPAAGWLLAVTADGTPEFQLVLEVEARITARGGSAHVAGRLGVVVRTDGDFDGDGLGDEAELTGPDGIPGTGDESDPGRLDADGDGETDGREVIRGGDPFDPCDVAPAEVEVHCLGRQGTAWTWSPIVSCLSTPVYNLYRGQLDVLRAGGGYTQPVGGPGATGARQCGVTSTSAVDSSAEPGPGETLYWLVTAESGGAETTLGRDTTSAIRPNDNPCP